MQSSGVKDFDLLVKFNVFSRTSALGLLCMFDSKSKHMPGIAIC